MLIWTTWLNFLCRRQAEAKLENIAMDTGGQSYFVDDDDYFAGLSDALTGSTTGFSQAVPRLEAQVKVTPAC